MSKIDEEIENTLEYIERVCRTTNVAERHYMNGINSIKQHISNQQEEIEYKDSQVQIAHCVRDELQAKLDKVKEIVERRLFEDTISKVEFNEILKLLDK